MDKQIFPELLICISDDLKSLKDDRVHEIDIVHEEFFILYWSTNTYKLSTNTYKLCLIFH